MEFVMQCLFKRKGHKIVNLYCQHQSEELPSFVVKTTTLRKSHFLCPYSAIFLYDGVSEHYMNSYNYYSTKSYLHTAMEFSVHKMNS